MMLADTLGRLLVAQQALEMLPAGNGMALFLSRTIETVPGVAAAHVCLYGAQPMPEIRAACAGCALSRGEATDMYGHSCQVAARLGLLALQIRRSAWLMGVAMLDVRDGEEFSPYRPYLECMLSMTAVLLENRAIVSDLKQARAWILDAHAGRERRLAGPGRKVAARDAKPRGDLGERESAARDLILDAIPAGIVLLDAAGVIVAANRLWRQQASQPGMPAAAGVGGVYSLPWPAAGAGAGAEGDGAGLRAVLRGDAARYEHVYRCGSQARPRWFRMLAMPFREGEAAGAVVMHLDVTASKEAEDRLHYLANYDPLTGLANRCLVRARLQQLIDAAARSRDGVAVLMLDIGRFKLINETLGHAAGDLLLKAIGERLSEHARGGDLAGRLGGDRFVLLLAGIRPDQDVRALAAKILDRLQQPYPLDGGEFFVTTNAGISLYPQDGEDVEALLKRADAAMCRAKAEGRNLLCFYGSDFGGAATSLIELENDLRHALERGELFLHYHPQVELESGRVIGVEALLRWQHPAKGLIPPSEFIPLAEETGLIDAIGEWALRQACTQGKAWQEAGLRPVRVAVNISSRQFRRKGLVDTVSAVLRLTRLEPRYLELEITESMIMHDIEQTVSTLHDLKALGIKLSVDDFGTGYSSLSYLKRFPVDTVKIDQSFVREVTTNPDDAAIVRAIVAMAHSLRLDVTAEGVETEGQQAFLMRHRCDEVQGFLFSRPLAPDECARLLREDRRLAVETARAGPRQRTLLVVDDEAGMRSSLVNLLRGSGYRVLAADSGSAGLELLAMHEVGVIISDQRMPEMAGVEFLRRVKGLYPDTVRIVLSVDSDLKSVADAIHEGAVCKFLTKPWRDELLCEQVREAFQHYDLKQEIHFLGSEVERVNDELSRIHRDQERRVAEQARELRRSGGEPRALREMLECLPMAVLGIGGDGRIVAANRQAEVLLGGGEPMAGDRLPAELAGCMATGDGAPRRVTLADGRRLHAVRHRLGGRGEPQCTDLLILFDGEGVAG